jgi:hypothetical protein
VAVRSQAGVCGSPLAGIAVSNPAGGMDVSCECCVLSGRGLCDGPITRPGVLPSVVCLSGISKPRQGGALRPTIAVEPWEKITMHVAGYER